MRDIPNISNFTSHEYEYNKYEYQSKSNRELHLIQKSLAPLKLMTKISYFPFQNENVKDKRSRMLNIFNISIGIDLHKDPIRF
jgi:hypothetical protein